MSAAEQDHSVQCRMLSNDTDGCVCQTVNAMPLVEAMDLFDRFWTANLSRYADEWTAYGDVCECGNCKTCGISYALSWTYALLSNPSLAFQAERKTADRVNAPDLTVCRCWRTNTGVTVVVGCPVHDGAMS